MKINNLILGVFILLGLSSCSEEIMTPEYFTERVIIIVFDGVRYSESWGDSSHKNIPFISSQLAQHGITYTQFFNEGATNTTAGHTALTTGIYQVINNTSLEHPIRPSFLQYYNNQYSEKPSDSWIISSKYKLNVLSNCTSLSWKNKHIPATSCGAENLIKSNRNDSLSFKKFLNVLENEQPNIALLSFMEPDVWAHKQDFTQYIKAIKRCDKFTFEIWEYIQSNPDYKNKTTLFVTNDHGRHLDSISNGFVSHGDSCEGCRHIFLYAYGPDFKRDLVIDTKRELIDIYCTIAELLHLNTERTEGNLMEELFK